MGSVFSQLLDTFPMHQAVVKVEEAFSRGIMQASANQARTYIRKLDASSAHTHALPAAATTPNPGSDRLWGFRHDGSPLNRVSAVDCRVREYDYQAFRVMEHIEWGMMDGSRFLPQVRITTTSGVAIDLPLSSTFLHSRYHLTEGYNGQNTHWLWPLECAMDGGLVVAFAYELVQQRGQTTPVAYAIDRDADSAAALAELTSGGDATDWGERVLRGDFMPTRSARSAPSREVGDSASGSGSSPRVVVAMTLAVNKERADFEPGGVAGMAKIYPQFMIKASIPLREVRATVRWERPSRSTVSAPGTSTSDHRGCGGDSELSITPLMVTDANSNAWTFDQGPFWSDIFAYYDDDWSRLNGRRAHVVKKNGASGRSISGYGNRRAVVGPNQTDLRKTARQGEFDSIHLAPSLRVLADRWLSAYPRANFLLREAAAFLGSAPTLPSRSSWHLDHVKMAPFCTHDCLHTHWRWGTGLSGSQRFVYGWSATAPYASAGSPMVPRNQDVYMTLPSQHEIIYEVVAGPVAHGQIPAYAWQVINHHGSGFVTGIASQAMFRTATTAVAAWVITADFEFFRGSNVYGPNHSSASFYWHLRYDYDPTTGISERVDLTPAQFIAARDL